MADLQLRNAPEISDLPTDGTILVNDGDDIKQIKMGNLSLGMGSSGDSGWRIVHEETLTEAKNVTVSGLDCTEVEAFIISEEAAEGNFYLTSSDAGTVYGEPRVWATGRTNPFIMQMSLRVISPYLWEGSFVTSNHFSIGGGESPKSGHQHKILNEPFDKPSITGVTIAREELLPVGVKVIIRGRNVKPDFLVAANGDVAYLANPQQLESTPLTATAAQDIRIGTVAVTNEGIVTGEKNFPGYETSQGNTLIMPGMELKVPLIADNKYDYTQMQAIICAYNSSISDSISVEKVSIDDVVYQVGSIDKISDVTKEETTQSINFGITNTGDIPLVIRYFTYKEID